MADDTICISDLREREKKRMWPRGKEGTLLRHFKSFFTIMQSLIHTQRQAHIAKVLYNIYVILERGLLPSSCTPTLSLHFASFFCASSHSIFACAHSPGVLIFWFPRLFSRRACVRNDSQSQCSLEDLWIFKLNGFVRFRRSFYCGFICGR